ncbi:alpha/beta hydrolase [Sphingomonas psychrolutea]|uniref:Alpha/beta hydrolase n=1 Tax=Sphingomonas psychrolutea TaxID=1259676 RepID=A0ABQ1G553_9SPHN|nr:alpha/beta hydrolase [Sphingomonas psychrolutea]GGA36921.1 alpha/beta hydrolase [Sphingomonas psychrolutea]
MAKSLKIFAYALLSLFGLAAIGSLIPAIPMLGELGPVVTSRFGPWVTLISILGAVWLFLRWRRNRHKRTGVVASLAAIAALGFGYVQIQQIAVARANGISIDLAQALLATSQSAANPKPETMIYAAYDGQHLPLDIYRPKPGSNAAPILVYVHGGGWGGQSLKQREADYRWFVARGYLVISIEYSLSTATRHTWNVVEPQLGCALAWVGANAGRYGGDVSRLALWGESAGGNLVLNLSYRASAGTLEPSCAGTVPHIAATLALYPVVDPARMYRPVDPLLGVFGRMMGDHYTGGSPETFPDRYTAIASATHINAKAPPTLLIIPESDHLVDPQAAYAFEAQARAAGIPTRLIKMPYAEHAFDLGSGSIGNQLVRQSMLRFLDDHGMTP